MNGATGMNRSSFALDNHKHSRDKHLKLLLSIGPLNGTITRIFDEKAVMKNIFLVDDSESKQIPTKCFLEKLNFKKCRFVICNFVMNFFSKTEENEKLLLF